jgi:hypothetical protein
MSRKFLNAQKIFSKIRIFDGFRVTKVRYALES